MQYVEGNPEYDAIAARNPLDMLLYGYILQLFEDQKLIIDSYFLEEDGEEEVEEEGDAKILALSEADTSLLPAEINANLANVNDPIQNKDSETPFFWHVPKSGGTTLQRSKYYCIL